MEKKVLKEQNKKHCTPKQHFSHTEWQMGRTLGHVAVRAHSPCPRCDPCHKHSWIFQRVPLENLSVLVRTGKVPQILPPLFGTPQNTA